MMAFLFERLNVYQRAMAAAHAAMSAARSFPRELRFLGDQWSRAAVSVAANIAEGQGRETCADQLHFYRMARGSAHECVALVRLAHMQAAVSDAVLSEAMEDLEAITRMLSGLAAAARAKRAQSNKISDLSTVEVKRIYEANRQVVGQDDASTRMFAKELAKRDGTRMVQEVGR